MKLFFENVNYVDDAGDLAAELVLTGGDIVGLYKSGRLEVGNARPDHDIVTLKSGKQKYRKTTKRQEEWTEELLKGEAVIGNLTFNLNPDEVDFEVDEEGRTLTVHSGNFDQAVDSATRTRAIIAAAESPAQTFDLDTRFSVRVWFADEATSARLFHIYNQRGEKVNQTVAKFQYQSTPLQRIARALMNDSEHLGIDNIEVQRNTVSANSHKLAAFNTLSQAIEGFWTHDPVTEVDEKAQAAWLVDFWDELVARRPEFGMLSKTARSNLRGRSVAGTAVSIHGVIALADAMYSQGMDFSALDGLMRSVTPNPALPNQKVDFFDYENPEWTNSGILVHSTDKQGKIKKTLRMSFQTRKAAGDLIKKAAGL